MNSLNGIFLKEATFIILENSLLLLIWFIPILLFIPFWSLLGICCPGFKNWCGNTLVPFDFKVFLFCPFIILSLINLLVISFFKVLAIFLYKRGCLFNFFISKEF